MESCVLKLLETGSEDDVLRLLDEFNSKFESHYASLGLDKDTYKRVWKLVLNLLCDSSANNAHLIGLKTLRILSRDKVAFNEAIDSDHLKVVQQLAGLVTEEEPREQHNNHINYEDIPFCSSDQSSCTWEIHDLCNKTLEEANVVMEAQRCLSNMIYNSASVQRLCCYNSCIEGLMNRLKSFKDPELPLKVKSFDMRILFLLSAFCADVRPSLRTEYHCLTYLIEILDQTLKTQQEKILSLPSRFRSQSIVVFNKDDCNFITDILKVLYNLVLHIDRSNPDEEEEGYCIRLVGILRSFLLATSESIQLTEELHSNSVNLLLVMPQKLSEDLMQPMPQVESTSAGFCGAIGGIGPEPDHIAEYDGKDMSAIVKLLEFLHKRLKKPSESLNESLTPILTLLIEMCQKHRIIRKFIRFKVLPPLRDVSKRPEEGENIRNKLCALMTSPISDVKYLTATFLFILCKEKVDRLIKYTGYGNAAGLLASRGLLLGHRGKEEDYSSESEDSETEEYEKMKDKVNPVTGRYEPTRMSPLDSMSDEQKEYEAMKLVHALQKLSRDSLIQPAFLGEDGKPHPVEHVLKLQENILNQQGTGRSLEHENDH